MLPSSGCSGRINGKRPRDYERSLAAAASVYSIDLVEDQQVQALRGLGLLEEISKQLSGRLGHEPAIARRTCASC